MIMDNYNSETNIYNEFKQCRAVEARIAKCEAEYMLDQNSIHLLILVLFFSWVNNSARYLKQLQCGAYASISFGDI